MFWEFYHDFTNVVAESAVCCYFRAPIATKLTHFWEEVTLGCVQGVKKLEKKNVHAAVCVGVSLNVFVSKFKFVKEKNNSMQKTFQRLQNLKWKGAEQ